MYKDISSYGLIGDMHAVALVSEDGSIDYCSMPHIDSPTVFAAILDDERGGYFKIQPQGTFQSKHEYIKDTNILQCLFKTDTGQARLMDFMPVVSDELFHRKEHVIHRCLRAVTARIDFILEFFPRPQYARGLPRIEKYGDIFKVTHGKEVFILRLGLEKYKIKEHRNAGLVIYFSLKEDEEAHFDFIYGEDASGEIGHCMSGQTKKFWVDWITNCVTGKCPFWGEYTGMINRSLLALKLLTFQPTGAIAAAATTSLPESLGGERNWDYRFTWLRDASFTLKAMFALGHLREADSFIHWLHNTYKKYGSRELQIMYSLEGETDLKEDILGHLKGYMHSSPVRIGNSAYGQRQWDIYGEVMDTALRLSDYAGKIDETLWPFFRDVCNLAVKNWRFPDDGIWEVRNGPFHFVYSKIMCWVAMDRGIKIAERYGFDAPLERWKREKKVLKEEVLEKGFNRDINSFVQRYGTEQLDASLLLLGLMKFLPINDKRMQGTIEACKKYLMKDGFLLRYASEDGLSGEEGAFLLCNFWLVECLALSGKIEEARRLLNRTSRAANPLGLFSEEYDYKNNVMLGNFPQAFSHIGYLNAVSAILNMEKKALRHKFRIPLFTQMQRLIPLKVTLNETDIKTEPSDKRIASQLKVTLNNLQGSFFNALEGRVDYKGMKGSDSFKVYIDMAGRLNSFDPFTLKTDAEKKAFWINIYNILIIHGVIYFDIQRSVQEVVNFFGRIGYAIGGMYFTPDDIEHGILRSNRPHPGSGKRQFSHSDRRKRLCIRQFDFRIHFALVCASSSCPPIEFYDASRIDYQLDVTGKSFVNRRGIVLDKSKHVVYLSQIFKWYATDFGKDKEEILEKVVSFVDENIAQYIFKNRKELKVKYLPYNWNLNAVLK